MADLFSSAEVNWADVLPVAEEAFAIWTEQRELAWAEKAWAILRSAGLTQFGTRSERGRVICRFLALADLYRDFCRIACEEECESDDADWAVSLDLGPFALGQLLGDDDRVELDDDEETAMETALVILIEQAGTRSFQHCAPATVATQPYSCLCGGRSSLSRPTMTPKRPTRKL